MRGARKIIHVDMDAFYASVEQRDRPELRGRPVIVGGAPGSRGVVCAASYEARPFGVHSALAAAIAYRRCPQAVFLPPDLRKYREVSRQVHEIFARHTDLIEPLSLDEAYLDVTDDKLGIGSATRVAEVILEAIRRETRLSASAGVAPNKFLAKVASDLEKPGGLVVVPPARVAEFVAELPIHKIPGVGRVTAERLAALGLHTCADVRRTDEAQLSAWFGRWGPRLAQLARGEDARPVSSARVRRSCSVEETFARDLRGRAAARASLERLAQRLAARLERAEARGRTVTLKVKYADFQQVTRSRTLASPVADAASLEVEAARLLAQTEVDRRPVRLLGIGVSHLDDGAAPRQLLLPFPGAPPP